MACKRASLIRTASEGHLKAFKALLQPDPSASLHQAGLNLEELAGIAIRHHHLKVLQHCIGIGANVNDDALRLGVLESNRLNLYRAVIPAGFVINHDHEGTMGGPLIWATLANHLPLAEYLLDHGADVNHDRQHGVYTPLTKAAQKNCITMLELFIRHGAEIDHSGALIVAAEHGNLEAVRCLVSHGANINLIRKCETLLYKKTDEEESALHKAVKGGHEDVVAFLVERGAELGLRDHHGRDALTMAVETNNAEVFDIIYNARKKLEVER